MIARFLTTALLCLAALTLDAHAQTEGRRASVVVELFTSQGCTQCPRANRLLGQFARQDDVLALTFPVGIWDYLGWTDTFARPEFTRRQRTFSETLRERRRTPQIIFNGARQVSASSWDDARAMLDTERAAGLPGPAIALTRQRNRRVSISIGAGQTSAPADIWYLDYEHDTVTVLITSGLNQNRSVAHYNLVTRIDRIGAWDGAPVSLERPRCWHSCAVLIQEPNGGRILAAAFVEPR